MQPRPGFARLLPLRSLTGLAAGTLALLPSARPVQAPAPAHRCIATATPLRYDGGCSYVPAPVLARGIVQAYQLVWMLSAIPGSAVWGLDVRNAEWAGVNLQRATFTQCDFRGCDLRGACLSGARL